MTKKPTIIKRDGYRFEWTATRRELAVDIYAADGVCLAKLGYPVIPGIGITDFMLEALHIAKTRDERRATAPTSQEHRP